MVAPCGCSARSQPHGAAAAAPRGYSARSAHRGMVGCSVGKALTAAWAQGMRSVGCAAMALLHTSCVFCDGVYLYDQCTCEAAVEGCVDSAPSSPCGAGRSLPATRAIAEGMDPGTRTHRTSDRPRGTRRQPLSSIARCYRSSACATVVVLQCIATQTCMFQPSTCMWVLWTCRTGEKLHVDQFRVFQLAQYRDVKKLDPVTVTQRTRTRRAVTVTVTVTRRRAR